MRVLESTYEQIRGWVIALVADLNDDVGARTVPATPKWSVHDVVGHLAGNCADILAGNIAGAATDEWTAAQIEARTTIPMAEIIAEWDIVGPKIAGMLDDLPGWYGRQIIADALVHEHDVRGALGLRGARSLDALEIALDFMISAVVHPGAVALGIRPVQMARASARGSSGPVARRAGTSRRRGATPSRRGPRRTTQSRSRRFAPSHSSCSVPSAADEAKRSCAHSSGPPIPGPMCGCSVFRRSAFARTT